MEAADVVVNNKSKDASPIQERRRLVLNVQLLLFFLNFPRFSFSNGSIHSIDNKRKKRHSESTEAQRRNSEAREVKNEMSKLIETEDAQVGTVTWSLYLRYFKRMGTALSITTVSVFLVYHVLSVYSNGNILTFSIKHL